MGSLDPSSLGLMVFATTPRLAWLILSWHQLVDASVYLSLACFQFQLQLVGATAYPGPVIPLFQPCCKLIGCSPAWPLYNPSWSSNLPVDFMNWPSLAYHPELTHMFAGQYCSLPWLGLLPALIFALICRVVS